MSLTFTDAQIKDLTQKVIDSPTLIAQADAQIAATTLNKAKVLASDNQNAVYTTNWVNILTQYHTEIKYLNGVLYTEYDTAQIPLAGQLLNPNIHFPTSPIWTKFQPKLDPSNTGLPTSVFANTETEALTRINTYFGLLKTGFTDGSGSTTTTGAFAVGVVAVTSTTGFSVGNHVLFISGSNFLYGTISLIAGLNVTVALVISSAGFSGILTGASMKNFHVGWTLGQRDSGTGASTGDSAYMAALKVQADVPVADWKTRLNAELTALNANDAVGTEKTQITAAKAQVSGHISVITTWQAFPAIGVGTSRFGTNLPALESDIAARPGEFATRIADITIALGGVTQNPDGTYSGTTNYFNLFDNLNLRLNKAGGTLRTYYDSDLGVQLFTQLKTNIINQTARDNATFNIQVFSQDANGSNVVALASVAGLLVSDAVKIMSSTQAVLTATISGISGNLVTLSITVPNTYKASESARLVKQN